MADTALDYAREAYYENYRLPAWDYESVDGGRDDDDLSDEEEAALLADAPLTDPMVNADGSFWFTKTIMSACGHWSGDLCEKCMPF
jgi:hypothetical protein